MTSVDGAPRELLPERPGDLPVAGGGVVAVHTGQGGVTAALEREVELPAELGHCRQPGDILIGEQLRLQ